MSLLHSFFLLAGAIFLQDLERSEVCISKQVGDARVGRWSVVVAILIPYCCGKRPHPFNLSYQQRSQEPLTFGLQNIFGMQQAGRWKGALNHGLGIPTKAQKIFGIQRAEEGYHMGALNCGLAAAILAVRSQGSPYLITIPQHHHHCHHQEGNTSQSREWKDVKWRKHSHPMQLVHVVLILA